MYIYLSRSGIDSVFFIFEICNFHIRNEKLASPVGEFEFSTIHEFIQAGTGFFINCDKHKFAHVT